MANTSASKRQKLASGLTLAAIGAGIDQTSKWLVVHALQLPVGVPHKLLPFLDMTLIWNHGISYGLFDNVGDLSRWILITFGVLITGGFIWAMGQATSQMNKFAYALIISGAIGNLIDRLVYGAVVDFISLHAAGFYWYVFNIADIWISLGVILLAYEIFMPTDQTG